VVTVVVLSSLLVIRLYVYAEAPWYDLAWIAATGRSLTGIVRGVSDEVIVLGTMLFLWWRAIGLSQRDFTFHTVGYEFRRNVLLLIGATLVLSFFVGSEVNVFVAPFFFFSLLAVALARVKDKSQVSGGIERPFGPFWLIILVSASLLVLGLAWLLSGPYSLEGWQRLLGWLDPFFAWLGRAVSWLIVRLLRLLGPVIEWLVESIRQLLGARGIEQTADSPLDDLIEQMREGAGEYGGPPAWVAFVGRYLCPGLSVLMALLLIVAWLERRRRWRRRVVEDESQSLWDEDRAPAGSGGPVRKSWERLRQFVARMGQMGVGGRLYAAVSVRYIYANVIRLARRRGFPRPPARTPNEFVHTLVRAFPGHESDLVRITSAYVKVHYGELTFDRAEVDELRAAWERLRSSPMPDHEGAEGRQSGAGEGDQT
jgi:hypothetical protein